MGRPKLVAGALAIVVLFGGCLATKTRIGTDAPSDDRWTSVYPGDYSFDEARVLEVGPYAMGDLERVALLEGLPHLGSPVAIEIGLYRPVVPEGMKIPIIVDAGPYYGESIASGAWKPTRLFENFGSHGYAIAAVSVRGSGGSGGCFDYMGPKEQHDLDKAITWLGSQEWSNGNVAMMGVSYDGSTPWVVAATGNPYLKTIVPIVGLPSAYEMSFHQGQSNVGAHIGNFHALYYAISLQDTTGASTAERAVCPETWQITAAAEYEGLTARRDPTGWWAARHHKPGVEQNYKGSILVAHGFHDPNSVLVIPWVDELNKTGIPTKQWYYQADHASPDRSDPPNYPDQGGDPLGRFTRWDWMEVLLQWFNYWLKNDTNIDLGSPAQIQDDKLRWRNEVAYPPRDAQPLDLHLAPGEALQFEPDGVGSELILPTYQRCPWNFCEPGSWLRECGAPMMDRDTLPGQAADFTTAPLENAVHMAGVVRLHAQITPHGPTGMLGGWLYDVDETGAEKRIGWGSMNLLVAKGEALPLVPEMPIQATMTMIPLDAYVPEGHALRLRVWNCPAYAYNPVQPPSPISLDFGPGTNTRLELPVIERGPDAFFLPPMPPQ